jgi:hypothetical protein
MSIRRLNSSREESAATTNCSTRCARRGRRALLFGGAIAGLLFGLGVGVRADNGQSITRVEEDWRIEFGTPDADLNAPQVTMTMSPSGGVNGHHAEFEINHRTQPDYSAGGLQLQRWWADTCLDMKTSHKQGILTAPNDVATFTLSMQAQSGTLTFGVSNGNSQTWGTFGNSGWLSLSTPWEGSDLSSYDPNTSLTNSYVGFGSNRVQRVLRTQVRCYSNSTLISTDSTQQVIYQYTAGN